MAPSLPSSPSTILYLGRIHDTAADIKNIISTRTGQSSHTERRSAKRNTPPIQLPAIPSITARLSAAGASKELAKHLSLSFERHALELRTRTQTILNRIWNDSGLLSHADEKTYLDTFWKIVNDQTSTFERLLEIWTTSTIEQVQRLSRGHPPANEKAQPRISNKKQTNRQPFNSEYTPLLEKYFEYNAYPSAPDRAVLARKAMLTPRQIEVWFQNHRNRAKKDGRSLRKLTSDPLPIKISLDSLRHDMPFFTIPKSERRGPFQSDTSELESSSSDEDYQQLLQSIPYLRNESSNFLNAAAPPHAFPSSYPPRCDYSPFPTSGKYIFAPPAWMRKPVTSFTPRKPIDFDEFVSEFALKLNLREGATKRKERDSASRGQCVTAHEPSWFAATHTRASSAPHPALIRSSVPYTVTAMRPFMRDSVLPPSLSSNSTMPTKPIQCSVKFSQRKIAGLPRRTPSDVKVSHRCIPSSLSLSPLSRTSSSSSNSSVLRHSSWSSNSSSSSFSTPTISPIFLPEPLAQSRQPTIFGVDFDGLNDLGFPTNDFPQTQPNSLSDLDLGHFAVNKAGYGFTQAIPAMLVQAQS